ncbi:YdiU family protein [Heliorestis acidaminivorans]|uniref:Protein nucleotidyltransferase YdiU n=1 Tax=Heliorestis acidaminivorans TaxID=553427 RepID=A0A6I0EXK6_9FIRM|nr:YdiU family protein [Heliorestis acidaminivorans]KAB2951963.1 YdiU family protein [Heliorestis acidaminivorans]
MTTIKVKTKQGWNLDNSYARLPDKLYSLLKPTPVEAPKLICFNQPLATALGLEAEKLQSNDGLAIFAGNDIPEGSMPLAQAYAGHQFGHFTMLGDGRAHLLGEQLTAEGKRFDIQLKGSGRTPYSRGGDGRAALGPMLREYIISEAMHALGIATTRSLAVVTTGESVVRETIQAGAILTRVAESHLRVGTFQYVANWGTMEEIQALADYTLDRHFPNYKDEENEYLYLLKEVSKRQAQQIAKWQLVGFVHGVMNTDNMTLSGETIDYGPCAFMDNYDPATVFSSIDRQGRYAYGNQPTIGAWNLARFAETLLPLIDEQEQKAIELAQRAIEEFTTLYHHHWLKGMGAKLGIFKIDHQDESLINELLRIMEKYHADYTNTFRALTNDRLEDKALFEAVEFKQWHEQWQARLSKQKESREAIEELMKKSNPAVIPRNHLVEEALQSAVKEEDYRIMERLLAVLAHPYDHSCEIDEYFTAPVQSEQPYRTFCGT